MRNDWQTNIGSLNRKDRQHAPAALSPCRRKGPQAGFFYVFRLHPIADPKGRWGNASNLSMAYVSKSISMPEPVYQVALSRQAKFGYSTLSDYIQALILQDVGEVHSRKAVPSKSAGQVMEDMLSHYDGQESKQPKAQKKKPGSL